GIRFYHPDHLGSTTVVTDLDGEVTQNVAYIPYGEVFVEQRNGTWNTPYLFNAKELDEETGLYYYGARYLDPTGTRWLSVDPLFEKYVGMTPYGYCAGNPVRLVDVDGRDYDVYIDDENKTITISTTYYTTTQDYESAQQSADYWNGQSGNFIYRVTNKKDKSDTKDYVVNFDIKVEDVGDLKDKRQLEYKVNKDKLLSKSSNVYMVISDEKMKDKNLNGRTVAGQKISVRESKKNTLTGPHEMGHTLGLIHSDLGLMTPSESDINRSSYIGTDEIKNMIEYPLRGRINSENGNDAGKGSLMPNSFRIDLKRYKGNVIRKK
ncbi:MAG: RHS repeat-associated core domain-containing protein, partial [Bacteroidales bacterium]|nr:RHS repeat-associated core domain-containing protein [Bacteroidales bacterium]